VRRRLVSITNAHNEQYHILSNVSVDQVHERVVEEDSTGTIVVEGSLQLPEAITQRNQLLFWQTLAYKDDNGQSHAGDERENPELERK
jgi:hypothetical protein